MGFTPCYFHRCKLRWFSNILPNHYIDDDKEPTDYYLQCKPSYLRLVVSSVLNYHGHRMFHYSPSFDVQQNGGVPVRESHRAHCHHLHLHNALDRAAILLRAEFRFSFDPSLEFRLELCKQLLNELLRVYESRRVPQYLGRDAQCYNKTRTQNGSP